jgi:phage shock protein PspC (stress-responsive transcriptional regulator)
VIVFGYEGMTVLSGDVRIDFATWGVVSILAILTLLYIDTWVYIGLDSSYNRLPSRYPLYSGRRPGYPFAFYNFSRVRGLLKRTPFIKCEYIEVKHLGTLLFYIITWIIMPNSMSK